VTERQGLPPSDGLPRGSQQIPAQQVPAQQVPAQQVEEAVAMLGSLVRRDWPIGPLTTYRVGGPAALFVEVADHVQLAAVGRAVLATSLPAVVLGRGSNLLVADGGFPGLVVTLGAAFAGIEIQEHRVRAGGAVSLPVLARRTAAAGLAGFEWAVGVPGLVGGAVHMNAGGHGSDMSRCLSRAGVVSLADPDEPGETVMETGALGYSYRHSNLIPSQVVTWVEMDLDAGNRKRSEGAIADIVRWRREHQPGGQNAGSVFTNPPGDSSGRVIQAAGLKGHRIGSASISTKHANFIQADPHGRADDVRALIEEVRHLVSQRLGIELVPEVRMLGFSEPGTEAASSAGSRPGRAS